MFTPHIMGHFGDDRYVHSQLLGWVSECARSNVQLNT